MTTSLFRLSIGRREQPSHGDGRAHPVRLALVALLLAAVGGCAAPPVTLNRQAAQAIGSAESVLVITQDSLRVGVDPTYIGGGLLDQLLASYIDKKRTESATTAADPVLKALDGYDFRAALVKAWGDEFATLTTLRFPGPVRVENFGDDPDKAAPLRRAAFERSTAGAVLFAQIDYALMSGKLVINARTELFPTRVASAPGGSSAGDPLDASRAVLRRDFSHVKDFITATNVRRALDEGAVAIAKKVAADIASPQP